MTRVPVRPDGFRGDYFAEAAARAAYAGASGPFRVAPLAVAVPRDPADVCALVAWAGERGLSLTPRGAGTGMPGGNVGPGVVVDLSRLDHLGEIEPGRDAVWVGPGVVAADLQRSATRSGLFLPPLPSSADRCTLGGMVANNAAGARSFRYGAVRDWIDALEVVLADGSLVRLEPDAPAPDAFGRLHAVLRETLGSPPPGWPEVRKNSSGYALDRFLPSGDPLALMVGAEGTLGVVTRIRVRLAPLPGSRRVALLPIPEPDDLAPALAAVDEAGAAACELLGSRFLDVAGLRADPELGPALRHAASALLVELDDHHGDPRSGRDPLERWAASLGVSMVTAGEPARVERLWSVRHAASPAIARRAREGLVSMQFVEDSVVPPGRLAAYIRSLEATLETEETDAVLFGHAGDGNVHVNPLVDVRRPDWRDRVRRILEATARSVRDLGGTLSGEHGDGRLRAPFHDVVWGAPLAGAFRRVKEALDPAGTLNPGVVVALPGQDPLAGVCAEPRETA